MTRQTQERLDQGFEQLTEVMIAIVVGITAFYVPWALTSIAILSIA